MKRKSVNPWDWGLKWSMDQGEVVEDTQRHLHCSGQVAVKPDPDSDLGISVVSPEEIRGQIECALANIDAILGKAGMTRSNIISLRFYTTDIDSFLANYDVYAKWIAEAGTRPPQSLLGVQRLFLPELMIEIEAVAAEQLEQDRHIRFIPPRADLFAKVDQAPKQLELTSEILPGISEHAPLHPQE